MTTRHQTRVALITGGTAGFGLALTEALHPGWGVITDGRHSERGATLPSHARYIHGSIADASHRARLADAVREHGRLDLLVHNASTLGPLPLRPLAELSGEALTDIWATNVVAAHDLNRLLLPTLAESDGVLVSLSSDAAAEHYPTWGGYGATKAALDHLTLTTGAEHGVTSYAVDPGDMRTDMHRDAFPGEDISDRPSADTVPPRLLRLLAERPASGRYRLEEWA